MLKAASTWLLLQRNNDVDETTAADTPMRSDEDISKFQAVRVEPQGS